MARYVDFDPRLDVQLLDGLDSDSISNELVDRMFASTKEQLNEAMINSYNYAVAYGIPKIVETVRHYPSRQGDDYYVVTRENVFYEKPYHIESNGVAHDLSIQEALDRDGSCSAPVYVSLSVTQFSSVDPRSSEKMSTLIRQMKEEGRNDSRAKRLRLLNVDGVQSLLGVDKQQMKKQQEVLSRQQRKITDSARPSSAMSVDMNDDDTSMSSSLKQQDELMMEDEDDYDEEDDDDVDYCLAVDFQEDERYQTMLKKCQESCRLTPKEILQYPFLVKRTVYPKHQIMTLPVMTGTMLCHNMNDMTRSTNDSDHAQGFFCISGKIRPMMRKPRVRFNANFVMTDDKQTSVQCRSAHAEDRLRSSSSTLTLTSDYNKMFAQSHLVWKIPYVQKRKAPFTVLFRAMGVLNNEKITELIKFAAYHYFRHIQVIPWERMVSMLHWSYMHHEFESEKIATMEDAWVYLQKMSDSKDEEEFQMDLQEAPRVELTEEQKQKQENAKLGTNIRKRKIKELQMQTKEAQAQRDVEAGIIRPTWIEPTPLEKQRYYGQYYCGKEILPHYGYERRHYEKFRLPKVIHLARMTAHWLLFVLSKVSIESIDLVANQRISLCSEPIVNGLLKGTLQSLFTLSDRKSSGNLHKGKQMDVVSSLDHTRTKLAIDRAFNTGVFRPAMNPSYSSGKGESNGIHARATQQQAQGNSASSKMAKDQNGITQMINSTNPFATISQQLRIQGSVQQVGGGNSEQRELHDDFGAVDFIETPDNRGCGLIKQHALRSRLSIQRTSKDTLVRLIRDKYDLVQPEMLYEYSSTFLSEALEETTDSDNRLVHIWVDGRLIGMLRPIEAESLSKFLKRHRYALFGEAFLSVANYRERRCLELSLEGGRIVRPLINARHLKRMFSPASKQDVTPLFFRMSPEQNLRLGFVEYIDKAEENNDCMIALNMSVALKLYQQHGNNHALTSIFTHVELNQLLIFGLAASLTPLASHVQGPRMLFSAAMAKQAEEAENAAKVARMDSNLHVMVHVSRPLVTVASLAWFRPDNQMYTGRMCMIANMCWLGDNVEDSIVVKQGACQLGLFRSVQYSTIPFIERKHGGKIGESLCRPSRHNTLSMKTASYEYLDTDGLPFVGSKLNGGDVVCGKVIPLDKPIDQYRYTDQSLLIPFKQSGIVTNVMLTTDLDEQRKPKIQLAKVCQPIAGDKLCLPKYVETLTSSGWISMDKLTMEHEIACLDKERVVYQKPINLRKYVHDGKMIRFQDPNNLIELTTTTEHRMWVSTQLTKDSIMEDEFDLVIATHMNKHYAHRWQKNASNMCVYAKDQTDEESHCLVSIFSEALLNDVHIERLDNMIWSLDGSTARELLEIYVAVWGIENNRNTRNKLVEGSVSIQSLPKSLADDLQRLCLHAGVSGNLTCQENGLWSLLIFFSENKCRPVLKTHDYIQLIERDDHPDADGHVYCPEVKGNVFYVRQNGKTCWTGNSSRFAQKTTMTMKADEDMPFNEHGSIPDLIINPHAFPSRMTPGQLIEQLQGWLGLSQAKFIDGTAYRKTLAFAEQHWEALQSTNAADGYPSMEQLKKTVLDTCTKGSEEAKQEEELVLLEQINRALEHNGFYKQNTQCDWYNGRTGERLGDQGNKAIRQNGSVFWGPIFEMKLIHQAHGKLQKRSRFGPRHSLTRQPIAGGLTRSVAYKVGEMEAICIKVHGAPYTFKDRHLDNSDFHVSNICSRCGLQINPDLKNQIFFCKVCNTSEDAVRVILPYSFKVLAQTLLSASLVPRYRLRRL